MPRLKIGTTVNAGSHVPAFIKTEEERDEPGNLRITGWKSS